MTISRYRKKPIVIKAIQLKWENWGEICIFADVGLLSEGHPQGTYVDENGKACDHFGGDNSKIGLQIPTLEGVMLAVQNDWIIRGVQGELYPCKPDIFEATYELVA